MQTGDFAPQRLGGGHSAGVVSNPRQTAYEGRVQAMSYSTRGGGRGGGSREMDNQSAAAQLRSMLVSHSLLTKLQYVCC